MLSSIRAMAGHALVVAISAALGLSTVAAGAASTLDELIELDLRAWSGEPELLSETYAPDGVHTATFYDRTKEYVGPEAIEAVARYGGGPETIGPRIDIRLAEGDWRWVSFVSLAGGSACLWHAVDGQIVHHDCLVPENSYDSQSPAGLDDGSKAAAIDEISERLDRAWGADSDPETLAAVYAADAVHSARFSDTTRRYEGPEEIAAVAGMSIAMETIGPRVDFDVPGGELAWAQVVDLGGGSVCLFRARDGMVIRHDCVLQIRG
ncbi:MAG TPA: hypothetical protein VK987_08935 [Anaerolineae bacterium]|nr:hypothetical protein [Anaerolineae bacterium]